MSAKKKIKKISAGPCFAC